MVAGAGNTTVTQSCLPHCIVGGIYKQAGNYQPEWWVPPWGDSGNTEGTHNPTLEVRGGFLEKWTRLGTMAHLMQRRRPLGFFREGNMKGI